MARTTAGRLLTEQHRRLQLALRAATLADLLRVWPAFTLDDIDGSWPPVEAALVTLIVARRRESVGLASNYFRAFRLAEGAQGIAAPRAPAPPNVTLLQATLRLLGPIGAKKQIARRASTVAQDTLTRISGSVTRQVLNGGRDTLERSIAVDREARGWRRVTDGSPCDFCADLASEGITSPGGGFPAHDHCGCSAEPAY